MQRVTRAVLPVLVLGFVGCGAGEGEPSPTWRPNVLLIVADDLAYTDLGVFGGEIGTPNLDALATAGMLLTNFYSASACSPTRAMLMSGVDNHRAGLGTMAGEHSPNQIDAPGYEGFLSSRVAALPALLRDAGYHTYMTGKWHLGMTVDTGPAARGFERSFGLMNGGAGHFDDLPLFAGGRTLYREGPDEVTLPEDFYSTRDFASRMIDYIDEGRGDGRPFFGYLAFTAPHWPLQAPESSIARFAGLYDDGYDELQARRIERLQRLGFASMGVEPFLGLEGRKRWDALSPDERRVEARKMEIYAAMVWDLDVHVGRVIDHLKRIGEYENTFVFFMSDNGAEGHDLLEVWPQLADHIAACCDNDFSNLGRGNSYAYYGPGWARAGVGVFRLYKGFTTEGGIRVPAFASFPGTVVPGRASGAFATVKDVLPTVLELAGVEHPGDRYAGREVYPPEGRSLMGLLRGGDEAVHDPELTMGWELFGRRAIRKGDWKLTFTTPPHGAGKWQLFHLPDDPSESTDLTSQFPEKHAALRALWDTYAKTNNVINPNTPSPY